ncbi:MAG: glutamate--tRNA ligase [Acidimicrobiales bacterium]|nr:MAG: glutamate--tRNA ligase [Acidimicrobiales bacterium]
MTEGPRVRFAPSPTGYVHVGSAWTALFNWLFARGQGGTFVLRIEDTDEQRNREEWVEGICSGLTWLGLDWDEGPYRQSERRSLYDEALATLLAAGAVYWCDCTREAVEARSGPRPGYDGWCRDRGLEPGPGRALRLRVPRPGVTSFDDVIRGRITVANEALDDFVVAKSSGAPLFLLANVVDDMAMGITHVIRAEDHLTNTSKAVLLWTALGGGPLPVFAHLPLLVNERRQKLSKRRDDVALEWYRDQGYLPGALLNYLALLGWGPEDGREVLSLEELVGEFRLSAVGHSPAYFDVVKLTHLNGVYIRALPVGEFVDACRPWLASGPWPPEAFDQGAFDRMAPLVQERVSTLGEVPAWVDFLFLAQPVIDKASWDKAVVNNPHAGQVLDASLDRYGVCLWEAQELHRVTLELGERLGLKLARTQAPIRVAVTGRSVGPPLFESLEVLGRDRTAARLTAALIRLRAELS